ncbi:hypothetical protein HUO13_17820 [Saccharopolyspora erythraea]|nr:hypothetical protein HUO13_17820 [Saccharopolyspora erythraea]
MVVGAGAAGPPKWAVRAAHAAALCAVPSGLWRIALGLGVPVGFSEAWLRSAGLPGWETVKVVALSVGVEVLALLTLGLVRRWGEVVPSWVPVLAGRPIPLLFAAVPAFCGAVALSAVTGVGAAQWGEAGVTADPGAPRGFAGAVMAACYAPMMAWGPLLLAVTGSYCFRRLRRSPCTNGGGTASA